MVSLLLGSWLYEGGLPAPPRPTDVLTRLEEEELRRPRSVISRGIAAIVYLLMYLSFSRNSSLFKMQLKLKLNQSAISL